MATSASTISLQSYGMLRDTALYIERPADAQLKDALLNGLSCIVTASRQSGKSSLASRQARELKRNGSACSMLDLTLPYTTSTREWFQWVTKYLAEDLAWDMKDYHKLWQQHTGDDYRTVWIEFLHSAVKKTKFGLVLLFDEVDWLLNPTLKLDAFFEGLYEFANARPQRSSHSAVTIGFFGVFQTSGQLLGQTSGSAFGKLIKSFQQVHLRPFTEKELRPFRPALADSHDADALLKSVYRWTSGQPHLTHRLIYELRDQPHLQEGDATAVVDNLVQQLYLDPGRVSNDFIESAQHRIEELSRIPGSDSQVQLALRLYRRVLSGESINIDLQSPLQQELGLLGFCRNESGLLVSQCLIVQKIYGLAWLEKKLTKNWFDTAFEKWKTSNEENIGKRDPKLLLAGWMLADAQIYLDQRERISPTEREFVSRSLRRSNQQEIIYRVYIWLLGALLFSSITALLFAYLYYKEKNYSLQLKLDLTQSQLTISSQKINLDNLKGRYDNLLLKSDRSEFALRKMQEEVEILLAASTTASSELKEKSDLIDKYISELRKVKKASTETASKLQEAEDTANHLKKSLKQANDLKELTELQLKEIPTLKFNIERADYTGTFPHTTAVDSVAILPDENLMVSGTDVGLVSFWSVLTQRIRSSIKVHTGHVNSIVISADGRRAASAGKDGLVVVFDAKTGAIVKKQLAHPGGANALAFSADGQWLLSGGEDGTAKLWRASNGDSMAELTGHKGPVSAVAFSQDGSTSITGGADKTARVWKLQDGKPATTAPVVLPGHSKWVSFVWLSTKGTRALVGTEDSRSYLWLIDGKKPRSSNLGMLRQRFSMFLTDQKKRESKGAILAMMQHDATTYFASTDSHGVVWIWEAFTGNPVQELAHEDNGEKQMLDNAAAFSPDGNYVATASADKVVRIWRLKKRPMKLPE